MKKKKLKCRHDYKNAIQIGNIDYMCPLCKNLLDPMEWFFMNSFTFIDVEVANDSKKAKKKTGKSVVTGNNFLNQAKNKKEPYLPNRAQTIRA